MSRRLLFAMLFIVASMAFVFKPSSVSAHTVAQPRIVASSVGCTSWYTVRSGDYLSRITSNWRAVASYNGIANPNLIYVGQRLCLVWSGSFSSPVTSNPVVSVGYTSKGPNRYTFGYCTWGAEELATRDLNGLGNAPYWAANARARGIPTGYKAVPGATAVFQPGYHVSNWGTSSGHVAHVNAVSGAMMQITEMNNAYYGGFGRWDTVWIAIVSGVEFIY